MPENDRFEKSLGAGWRAAYQYVKNDNATPEEINDKLVESLTRTLRKNDGVPGLHAMREVIVASLGSSLLVSFDAADEIVGGEFGHRHTKVAARVAKSLLPRNLASGGTLEPQNIAHSFVEKVCFALVEHYFFARVCPNLVAIGRFADHEEASRWRSQVEKDIQPTIEKVAVRLSRNADAKGLRAPRRTATKILTSDIMEETIVQIESVGGNALQ